ncbi:hypothetical protein SLH46_04625 [Draconibacterium sp. IB214405]|uniref:hypothetical protein n=1 Tax=Draconibacterium sp. IB214405 TaxID=3097352 RepID=UPI002A177998|nr:hypothetical protein [Draconibacterium sp. IB214405]MDX8338453.1 hypothetical protein [Draconibacterium sp. IB214405]
MKKTLQRIALTAILAVAGIFIGNAQEIGVRFGDVSAGSVAIDGIFSTGEFNRLHADLSFGDGVAADLLWDFFYRPLADEAFNWYMGVGPYLAILDEKKYYEDGSKDSETNFNLGAAFEIGLEYRFVDIPLALGIDYRPSLEVIDETNFHWGGFGLNVRYVFQ